MLRAWPGGGGAPGGHTPWSSLAACIWRKVQPQDELSRASKPALLKLYCEQDSPGIWRLSVGLGYRPQSRVPNSLLSQLTLLVHRPHLEQQGSRAGRAEISCKGPGSTFLGFGGLMVYAQKSQQTVENSSREGNTRPPYLPPKQPVCRSRSNSQNLTWIDCLGQNWERSMTRLYIVTLFI